MKVFVITATLEETSGWGRYSAGVVRELRRKGITVEVWINSRPTGVFGIVRNCIKVRKAAHGADVIHAFDGWPYGFYGYAAVVGKNIPLYINAVGTYSVAPLYSARIEWLLRLSYSRAKKIFCISNYLRQQLTLCGIALEKLVVVHLAATPLPVLSSEEIQHYNAQYPQLAGALPIVLTVGEIKERKGQMETLKAIRLLQKEYANILYVTAGAGNHGDYIEEMRGLAHHEGIEKNLLILENLSDRALSYLYSCCTVYALNSITDPATHHMEGFGLTVLEAAQFGKPAVGSRDSGIADAIEDGVSGLLCNQHDPVDIARQLRTILKNLDFYSKNAKNRYVDFNWGKTVDEYVQHYSR